MNDIVHSSTKLKMSHDTPKIDTLHTTNNELCVNPHENKVEKYFTSQFQP